MSRHTGQPVRQCFGFSLIASLAGLIVFLWLALSVARGAAIWFDPGIRAFVHQNATPGFTTAMRFMSDLGEPRALSTVGIGALIAMLALRWRREAIVFLIALSGASTLDWALKVAFHRTRPAPFFGTPEPHSFSFPSGHALFSICVFGTLAIIATERVGSRARRAAIWVLVAALIGAIGLSRIYLGVHYPSDVLGGYAAALFWIGAVMHLNRRLQPRGCSASVSGPR
jgi:undecaprenyl-diphosphatase